MFSRFNVGLILVFLVLSGLGVQAQQYVYGVGAFPVGQSASKMITADFNNDGAPDIAVLGVTSTSAIGVSILLGQSDGLLAPAVNYPLPANTAAISLTVGDFNGDGKLDLVVAAQSLPQFFLFLGNGDGTFQSATSFAGPSSILLTDVVSGDFNHDGKLDVAATGSNGSTQSVDLLLGNGDGTFQAAVSFNVGTASSNSIVAGDLNGDGILDLVLGSAFWTPNSVITVLFGVGDGTFQLPVTYSIPGSGTGLSLALADMNSDGKLDVVAGISSAVTGGVAILLNQGNGVLISPVVYSPNLSFVTSIAVADFNADGNPDVAVTESLLQTVQVFLGNANGTLGNPIAYGMANQSHGIVAADFNQDGRLDLAAEEVLGSGSAISVLIGQGNGTFGSLSQFSGDNFPFQMAVADFNGDGHSDVVLSSFQTAGQISVLLGQGGEKFQSPFDTPVGNHPTFLATGDFNQDGHVDAVFTDTDPKTNSPRLGTLLGNGDGTFSSPVYRNVPFIQGKFAVADFNGDGKLDLAAADVLSNTVNIYPGLGDGTFGSPISYATLASPEEVWTADFNGDGHPDLAIGAQNGGTAVLMNNGNGTFQATQVLSSSGLVAVADFDNDGKQDLLLTGTTLFGNGDGTFRSAPSATPLSGPGTGVQVGDFNGDGNKDLAFPSPNMAVYLGKGDGSFGERIDYFTPNSPFSMAVGDFGSGGTDIVLGAAGATNGTFEVYASAPVLSVVPNHLTFSGAQFTGTSSAAQTVTLSNVGSTSLVVSNFAVSPDFSQQNNCGSQILPGNNCAIQIALTPTTIGTLTGTLSFHHTAAGGVQVIPLTGQGKGFQIGTSQASATITAGQTASYTVDITPASGNTDTVSLTCTGAPSHATCSTSPSSIALDGVHAVSVAVKVTTTAPSAMSAGLQMPSKSVSSKPGLFAVLVGFALIGLVVPSTVRSRGRAVAALVLWAFAIGAASCGGGSSQGSGPPGPGTQVPGTTPGTYTLKISAQATSGGTTYGNTLSLTLVVQ